MRKLTPIFVFLTFGGLVSAATLPDRAMWSWTLAERVAARSDHFARPAGRRPQAAAVSAADGRLFIDGRTNPEFLMPAELFNALLQGISDDADVRQVRRDILSSGIKSFGLDEAAFWTAIERATASYRSDLDAYSLASVGSQSTGSATAQQADVSLCRSRTAALQTLRKQFAADGFDRFLYIVVAPTITVTTSVNRENPEHLMSVERGCQ